MSVQYKPLAISSADSIERVRYQGVGDVFGVGRSTIDQTMRDLVQDNDGHASGVSTEPIMSKVIGWTKRWRLDDHPFRGHERVLSVICSPRDCIELSNIDRVRYSLEASSVLLRASMSRTPSPSRTINGTRLKKKV